MTDYKLEIEEARTLFWEKMSELVIEYELYNFDPNIKEMERDLMEAYDKSAQALTHLIETEKKKVGLDPFDFVEPCEPDCTPVRHAYHQGQWDMATRMSGEKL